MKPTAFIAILTFVLVSSAIAQTCAAQESSASGSNGDSQEEAYDPARDPAFAVWRSLSAQGEPDSFFLVAQRYELGEIVEANPITALQYYILAAELDHKEAESAIERLSESLSKREIAEARARAADWSPVTDEDILESEPVPTPETDEARLLAAADLGEIATVRELLDQGLAADVRDEEDWTPLMLASLQGHENVVELLLDRGADADARGVHGTTALMAAARSGWLSVVKLLMDAGADMELEDNAGETAIYMAELFGHRRVASFLARVTAPPEVIMEVQTFLIEEGYKLGRADGLWGPNTEKAVQAFQTKQGLRPDGRITKKLLRVIRQRKAPDGNTSGDDGESKKPS